MASKPESLTNQHDLTVFDCGKEPLTSWLRKYALQSQNSGQTKTMVVTEGDKVVIAYYTYNIISVQHEDFTPERVKKGLAKSPIPVFQISRLARDSRYKGKGLGGSLLRHALKGAAAFSITIPIRAIIVDAIDEKARAFYIDFDFEPYPADSLRMWLLMKDLLKSLNASTSASESGLPESGGSHAPA